MEESEVLAFRHFLRHCPASARTKRHIRNCLQQTQQICNRLKINYIAKRFVLNEKRWPVTFSDVVTHIVDIRATSVMGIITSSSSQSQRFFCFSNHQSIVYVSAVASSYYYEFLKLVDDLERANKINLSKLNNADPV